jgi:hypothetical protein
MKTPSWVGPEHGRGVASKNVLVSRPLARDLLLNQRGAARAAVSIAVAVLFGLALTGCGAGSNTNAGSLGASGPDTTLAAPANAAPPSMTGCPPVSENLRFTPLAPGGLSGHSTVGFGEYPGECSAPANARLPCGTADQSPGTFAVGFSFLLDNKVYEVGIGFSGTFPGPGSYAPNPQNPSTGWSFWFGLTDPTAGNPGYVFNSGTLTINSDEASGAITGTAAFVNGPASQGGDTHVSGTWRCG